MVPKPVPTSRRLAGSGLTARALTRLAVPPVPEPPVTRPLSPCPAGPSGPSPSPCPPTDRRGGIVAAVHRHSRATRPTRRRRRGGAGAPVDGEAPVTDLWDEFPDGTVVPPPAKKMWPYAPRELPRKRASVVDELKRARRAERCTRVPTQTAKNPRATLDVASRHSASLRLTSSPPTWPLERVRSLLLRSVAEST